MRPSNHLVFSGGIDPKIKMWDINKQVCIGNLVGDHSQVYCIQNTYDQDFLVGCGADGFVHIWDTRDQKEHLRFKTEKLPAMNFVSLSSSAQSHCYSSLLKHSRMAGSNFFKNDNKYSAQIAHINGAITQWDMRKPASPLLTLNLHTEEVRSVEYDPSGNYILSSSFDMSSVVYDLKKQKILQRIKVHDDKVVLAKWHPFFPIITTTSADSTVRILVSDSFLSTYK